MPQEKIVKKSLNLDLALNQLFEVEEQKKIANLVEPQRMRRIKNAILEQAQTLGYSADELMKLDATIKIEGNKFKGAAVSRLEKIATILDNKLISKYPNKTNIKDMAPGQKLQNNAVLPGRLFFNFSQDVMAQVRGMSTMQEKVSFLRNLVQDQLAAQGVSPEAMQSCFSTIEIANKSIQGARGSNLIEQISCVYASYFTHRKTEEQREAIQDAQMDMIEDIMDNPGQFLDDVREGLGIERQLGPDDSKDHTMTAVDNAIKEAAESADPAKQKEDEQTALKRD